MFQFMVISLLNGQHAHALVSTAQAAVCSHGTNPASTPLSGLNLHYSTLSFSYQLVAVIQSLLQCADNLATAAMGGVMKQAYPNPQDVGIKIPPNLQAERYCAGFRHGLKGGHLDQVEYMKQSFREGFRAAKLYLRELRRSRGILEFPTRWRLRMKVA